MVGIDEAGRGSLAGSMYLAAVKTPPEEIIKELQSLGLRDSKKLSKTKREKMFNYIKNNKNKFEYIICKFSPKELDEKGLSYCYKKGLSTIYEKFKDEKIVFDGNTLYGLNLPIITETKADDKYLEVSLASVIAKVKRDLEIEEIAKKYPEYQWNKHNGYPQNIHKEMVEKYGILKSIHRESWKTISKLENKFYY